MSPLPLPIAPWSSSQPGRKHITSGSYWTDLNRMDNPDLMYFHFWAGLLRPHFLDPEYPNDFGAWAYHSLHDKILAERLSIINPADFASLDQSGSV
jgi:hypothetical protein